MGPTVYFIRSISAPAVTTAGPAAQAVVQSTPPLEGWDWVNPHLRELYIKNMFKLRNFFVSSPFVFFKKYYR